MINIKYIIFILLFIGITFVIIDLTRIREKTICANTCKPTTIYKYVPRTFKEEQESPVSVMNLFHDLFERPSPWIGSFADIDSKKPQKDAFVTQG